jgi:hypothetical protein
MVMALASGSVVVNKVDVADLVAHHIFGQPILMQQTANKCDRSDI